MKLLALLVLVTSACQRGVPACAELERQVRECMPPGDLKRHCDVALQLSAEPPDASPSFAELERRAFAACVGRSSCRDALDCLSAHGCKALLLGPSDRAPKWSCF